MMSHLVKIYTVCKFTVLHFLSKQLLYLINTHIKYTQLLPAFGTKAVEYDRLIQLFLSLSRVLKELTSVNSHNDKGFCQNCLGKKDLLEVI